MAGMAIGEVGHGEYSSGSIHDCSKILKAVRGGEGFVGSTNRIYNRIR